MHRLYAAAPTTDGIPEAPLAGWGTVIAIGLVIFLGVVALSMIRPGRRTRVAEPPSNVDNIRTQPYDWARDDEVDRW